MGNITDHLVIGVGYFYKKDTQIKEVWVGHTETVEKDIEVGTHGKNEMIAQGTFYNEKGEFCIFEPFDGEIGTETFIERIKKRKSRNNTIT